jgi:hypothetical protein
MWGAGFTFEVSLLMLLFPFSNEEVFQSAGLLNFFGNMPLRLKMGCLKGKKAFFS